MVSNNHAHVEQEPYNESFAVNWVTHIEKTDHADCNLPICLPKAGSAFPL